MRISYDLSVFPDKPCDDISLRLHELFVSHLPNEKTLLIDSVDISKVEQLLSDLGAVEALDDFEMPPSPTQPPRYSMQDFERFLSEQSSGISTSSLNNNSKSEDEPGAIAMAGSLLSGVFGVLMVMAAFLDPTFEGRVLIFLPAIILGVIGFAIGSRI